MKKLIYTLWIIIIALFYSCDGNKPSQSATVVEESLEKGRDSAYYLSKDFQIFPQYHLAIKCPVILTDISLKTKANFDMHYGGIENNETSYEIIVIHLPLGYQDLSETEKIKFEENFLFDKFPGKAVIIEMGGKEINAYVMEYSHQRGQGKGIAFIFEGKAFAFNVIAKDYIETRFNTFSNSIIFYHHNDKT